MNPPNEHQSARMRHLREDDNALVFPRRPTDPTTLDVDSSRHARVFADDVMSGINNSDSATMKASQARARLLFIGGIGCFIFLLITLSFYSNLSSQENLSARDAIGETNEDFSMDYDSGGEGEVLDLETMEKPEEDLETAEENIESDSAVITSEEEMEKLADALGGGGDLFIMDINGIRFEIGIGMDGDFNLPQGLILNPHVRQHWALIQRSLGIDYYDYQDDVPRDEEDKIKLEQPEIENGGGVHIEVENIDGKEVRMPEGLLFEAPSIDKAEHVHGKDCDSVSIDVEDEGVAEPVEPDMREVTEDLIQK